MNKLQVFNTVSQHLLAQNKKSVKAEDKLMCAYRGKKGLSCAIGCLIPDDLYDPKMEGDDVLNILNKWPDLSIHLDITNHLDASFLYSLQSIHDDFMRKDWAKALTAFKNEHELC